MKWNTQAFIARCLFFIKPGYFMVKRNELYWLNVVCCFRTRAAIRLDQSFWSTPHSAGRKEQNLRKCACVSFVWNNNDTRIEAVLWGKENSLKNIRRKDQTALSKYGRLFHHPHARIQHGLVPFLALLFLVCLYGHTTINTQINTHRAAIALTTQPVPSGPHLSPRSEAL